MILLDIFEIIVSSDLHLCAGSFICDDDSFRMQLQCGNRPHLIDSPFNGLLQRARFVMSVYHNQNLFGIQYRSDSHCYRRLGNFVHIIVKEARVGDNRIRRLGFHTCPRRQRRARLIKRDMPVRTYTAQEKIHTAYGFHLRFIRGTFCFQIFSISI